MSERAIASPKLVATFGALTIAAVFLQKFGLTIGDGSVGLDTGLLVFGLGFLVVRGEAEIVEGRLVLLLLTAMAALIGVAFSTEPARLSALGIVMVIYASLAIRVRTDEETVSRCLAVYQRCMLIVAAIVLVQQILQYGVGNQTWPNLDAVVPEAFLYPGFAYLRPYAWQSPYLTPNGVFFLEPSVVSGYVATAIMIEIVWFRNAARITFYVVALVAGVAATGPVMLLVTAPVWGIVALRRLPILWLGVPVVAVAFFAGAFDMLLDRSTEISASNSSGYYRLIAPLQSILDHIEATDWFLSGNGPGTSAKFNDAVQWPFSKILYEYGTLTAILFNLYVGYCLFQSPISRTLSFVLFVPYEFFGGGFVSHATVMPLILFCSLLSIGPAPVAARRDRPREDGSMMPLPARGVS